MSGLPPLLALLLISTGDKKCGLLVVSLFLSPRVSALLSTAEARRSTAPGLGVDKVESD